MGRCYVLIDGPDAWRAFLGGAGQAVEDWLLCQDLGPFLGSGRSAPLRSRFPDQDRSAVRKRRTRTAHCHARVEGAVAGGIESKVKTTCWP